MIFGCGDAEQTRKRCSLCDLSILCRTVWGGISSYCVLAYPLVRYLAHRSLRTLYCLTTPGGSRSRCPSRCPKLALSGTVANDKLSLCNQSTSNQNCLIWSEIASSVFAKSSNNFQCRIFGVDHPNLPLPCGVKKPIWRIVSLNITRVPTKWKSVEIYKQGARMW